MPAPSQGQPAYVQDCHSDDDGVDRLGDKVEARVPRANSRAPRRREPTPSDSGYSSHTSGTKPVKPADPLPSQAMVRQAPSSSSSKSSNKTVVRRDSAQTPSATLSQTQPPDPYCRDPNCSCTRTVAERRMSAAQPPHQAVAAVPLPALPPQQPPYLQSAADFYQREAQNLQSCYHPYSQMAAPPMPPAVPQPMSRPRTGSSTRQRPMSIHGYPPHAYGTSFDDSQKGPPPSASAYYPFAQPGYLPQHGDYLASTPPDPTSIGYPPYSPGPTSPASPTSMGSAAGYMGSEVNMYSTRRRDPTVPGLVVPKMPAQPTVQAFPTRSLSARRPEPVRTPALALQEPESPEYSSEQSDSSSDEDTENVIVERAREPVLRRTDEMALTRRKRRPSLTHKYHTTANIPIQDPRPQEPLRRAPQSDSDFSYYSSSDHMDPDRNIGAMIHARDALSNRDGRRPSISTSRGSRRPSVSTNPSSDRTKATTVSDRSDYTRVVVEDKYGRRTKYLSGDQADQLKRFKSLEKQGKSRDLDEKERTQMCLDEAATYQRLTNGEPCEPFELTADYIRKTQNRKNSRLLGARTAKSSNSGSRVSRPNDGGIRIESGGTVLHVYGDAQIEMRRDEEGGPAHLIVNGGGRDSGYNTSSRSTDSRHGRSRIGSEMSRSRRYSRQPIYEEINEGGYERNL